MKLLCGLWRFSGNPYISKISNWLCAFRLHVWVMYCGKPVNCGVCGKIGDPFTYIKLNQRIEKLIG